LLTRHPRLVVEPELFWRPAATPKCSPDVCALAREVDTLRCSVCDESVPITDDVIELVDDRQLDEHKRGELAGNALALDDETILRYSHKQDWSSFTNHFIHVKLGWLARALRADGVTRAAFLGAGTGFEIGPLLAHGWRPQWLALSDLSRSTLEIAAYSIAINGLDASVPVCLFTSDLDAVPLRARDLPIVIYECLHHTPDMHASLEALLSFGYERIFLVEPCTNVLMRQLARRGLAQRVEYSGVEPDRFDLRRVRDLCARHGYTETISTLWEFPDDYYRRVTRGKGGARGERAATAFIDGCSAVGRPFQFGNFAMCILRRT
jgi:hypothetical protein